MQNNHSLKYYYFLFYTVNHNPPISALAYIGKQVNCLATLDYEPKYIITRQRNLFSSFQHDYLTQVKSPFFIIKDYIIDWH